VRTYTSRVDEGRRTRWSEGGVGGVGIGRQCHGSHEHTSCGTNMDNNMDMDMDMEHGHGHGHLMDMGMDMDMDMDMDMGASHSRIGYHVAYARLAGPASHADP
jgi:hypothetical protein